jgi:RNA polymerase sigma factor (sigma-70 family)
LNLPALSDNASSDEELIQQVALRRPRAMAVLFDRHHRKLFTFFVKLGQARSTGEDLVQETFLRMLRYATSFRPGARFSPWMYQIARNVAADAFNARPREEAQDHETLESLANALSNPLADGPECAHSLGEMERRLQQALLMLPRDKRELVLLSRIRQLSTEDLAGLFGCSANAVKVRLHRSLEELRGYFDALEHDTKITPVAAKRWMT